MLAFLVLNQLSFGIVCVSGTKLLEVSLPDRQRCLSDSRVNLFVYVSGGVRG